MVFDAAIAGEYDANFAEPAQANAVHVSGSVHMIVLSILNDLYGIDSAAYYKTDPERYARTNLIASRLLGIHKFYTAWALYAFTCEAVGQAMMYPDKFPPGSDPDKVLITRENWRSLEAPDFDNGIPRIINDMLRVTQRLTGMEPLLQISAPYSLAADIFGQEPLLAEVVHDPDFVNELLDHLADTVLLPWIEHFLSEFPNGWIELSDASGSPFFIGPDNCKTMAIRSMKRMTEGKPWADRLFDCNYRGDYVTQARKRDRSSRRRSGGAAPASGVGLEELTELKHGVCPKFIIRLEADRVALPFYEAQALARGVALTTGIGASQVDRNSIPDMDMAKTELKIMTGDFVGAIKRVCEAVGRPDDALNRQPWPSHVYFEDISSQSEFDLIELIIQLVQDEGAFDA